MKKLSLFFFALSLSAMAMADAKTITFDFSDKSNPWDLPSDYVIGENTYTNDPLSVKINGVGYVEGGITKGGAKAQVVNKEIAGLIMGKQDSYITLPAFDFDVATIKVYGLEGGSGSTKFNVFVGETAVSTEVTSCKVTQSFKIAEASQAKGTVYSIKVTSKHNIQISKIEVIEAVAGAPENPVFSPKAGTYISAQTVSITCSTDEAAIQYSFDNESFSAYTEPLLISETTTIYAKAVKNQVSSEVVSATYTIVSTTGDGSKENPYTIADVAVLASPGDSAWVTGVIVSCAANGGVRAKKDTTDGNLLLGVTVNDSTGVPVALPTKKMKDALGLATNPGNKGKTVKVYGALVSYFGVNGIKNTSDYELVIPAGTPETPTFSVPGGTYTSAISVTISCATDGADILYSFDGESFSAYTDPLTITEDATLYAKAEKAGLTSSVAQATYTFYTPVGSGTKEDPYIIADLVAFNNPGDSAWVGGYILGCANSSGNLITDTSKYVDTNVLLADEASATKGAPIMLSLKAQKDAIGVASHPENIGKYLKVYGAMVSYMSKAGVKNVSDYELEGGTTLLEIDNAISPKAVKIIENGKVYILRNGEKYTALGVKL